MGRFLSLGQLVLIKGKPGKYSKNKRIEYYNKAYKAKPGKYLEIVLYNSMPQVLECFKVNLPDK